MLEGTHKEGTHVDSSQPRPRRGRTWPRRVLVAGAWALHTSCALLSLPERQGPSTEQCPRGAVEALRELGIRPGAVHPVSLASPGEQPKPLAVREGPGLSATLVGDWGRLPGGTVLYGQVYFGAGRVFARFTEARLPEGRRLAVCLQLVDSLDWEPGLVPEFGSRGAQASLWPVADVEAVVRYE
jgi:hypothetical protein